MPLFQTGTGYRDPNKAMTIKALQERQKLAAAATEQASAMPAQIASPWQGAAHLANILGSSVQQGRADAAEADARDRLTQIMAGVDPEKGFTPQQYAEARALDPEMADRQYEAAMAERRADENRRETQAFTTSEREAGNAFTGGQNDLSRQATAAENDLTRQATAANQKMQEAAAAGRQEDAQAAAQELARINAQLNEQKAKADAARDVTAIGTETDAKAAEAKKLGLVEGSPEYQKFVFDISPGASTNIYNQGDQPAFAKESDTLAAKRLGTVVEEGQNAKPFMAQLKIVADLGKTVGTGKWAEVWASAGPYIEAMGIDVTGLGESQAFKAIVDKMAPNMRVQGAGASSDFDARQFLNSLPRLGNDPVGNKVINDTFAALMQNKMAAAEIAARAQSQATNPSTGQPYTWQEAEAEIRALPDPYETFKQFQSGGATPPPPAATDTGAGDEQSIDDILKGIP